MKITDKEVKEFLEPYHKHVTETMSYCMVYTGIVIKDYLEDPMCLMQLGAAICLNKPLVFLLEEGTVLPEKLRLIADGIFEFKEGDKVSLEFAASKMKEFLDSRMVH